MKHRYLVYLSILIYWSPSNILAYLWGFVLLAILLLSNNKVKQTNYSKNIIIITFLFVLLFLSSFILNYFIFNSSFNNLFWSLITYGSVLSFLVAILMLKLSIKDIKKILFFSVIVTLIEVAIGYGQMVYLSSSFNPFSATSAAGDYFTGTFMRSGFAHMAALKISLVLIYVFAIWIDKKTIKQSLILIVLILGWLLPSALYSVLLLAASIAFYFVIYEFLPRLRKLRFNTSIIFVLIISFLGIILLFTTQKKNFRYVVYQVKILKDTILDKDKSINSAQKIHYFRTSLLEVPKSYPHAVIIGVGPGNYSSRSAWVVSGLYLKNQPFYIPSTPSEVAIRYSLPYFEDIRNKVRWGAGSIIHQPFSSWISIYVEQGIIGIALIIWIFVLLSRKKTQTNAFLLSMSKANTISIFYILLLMGVDNILEYAQFTNQFLIFVVMVNNVELDKNISEQ